MTVPPLAAVYQTRGSEFPKKLVKELKVKLFVETQAE
jgi:hypothetical protein